MKRDTFCVALAFCILMWLPSSSAQQASQGGTSVIVPRLIRFGGILKDSEGRPRSGMVGVTFGLYRDQEGGAALWLETQNVSLDASGRYSVLLGATKEEGVPMDLFTSGQAQWLGVHVQGQPEQPRVLLVSVPYALKAADAETLAGLPPSAFAPASKANSTNSTTNTVATTVTTTGTPITTAAPSGSGTLNFVPLWTSSSTLGNSTVSQLSGNVGIGFGMPLPSSFSAKLDVNGGAFIRGLLQLPATGNATSSGGKNSNTLDLVASSFSSSLSQAMNQRFRWQAEPVGNNSSSPSGKLNLLYGLGATTPSETGLSINNKGLITFAPGQTFPRTVTSVGLSAPITDFKVSGSPVTKSGTLALSWNVAPTSADTPKAIVKRDSAGSFHAAQIFGDLGVAGFTALTCSSCAGVSGVNNGGGTGMYGTGGVGVYGMDNTNSGIGVKGLTGAGRFGVYGENDNPSGGSGVFGDSNGSSLGFGVFGNATGSDGVGIAGSPNLNGFAVVANSIYGSAPIGVFGDATSGYGMVATSDNSNAFLAENGSSADTAVIINEGGGIPLFVAGASTLGGAFNGAMTVDGNGNLSISGTINKGALGFMIDHPLDPANKYLHHSGVESPDMMNLYNGNAILDGKGEAVVELPSWFETLNRDFRYQLTCTGGFAPVYIARKVQNNSFKIAGGQPGMEVSWQVTGIRQDPYANAHRIPVEEVKPTSERGYYIHPELYGASKEKGIAWEHHAAMMKQARERGGELQPPSTVKQ